MSGSHRSTKRNTAQEACASQGELKRKPKLVDGSIVRGSQETMDFITNILESSTEYSIIATDLDGGIILWSEGAQRLYGYEPVEVGGRANVSMLHIPEDVKSGKAKQFLEIALRQGKWEGTINRRRKE